MLETRGDVAEALSRRKGGNGIRSWYEVVDAELSAALALYCQRERDFRERDVYYGVTELGEGRKRVNS